MGPYTNNRKATQTHTYTHTLQINKKKRQMQLDRLPVGIPGVTFDNDCNGCATEVHTLDDGIIAVGVDGDDKVFPQVVLCVSTLV